MLTFAHIWMLLLAPLPLLVRWLMPPRQIQRQAVRVPFLKRLEQAGAKPPGGPASGPLLVQSIVWLLLVIAMARPQWLEDPIERTVPTRDLLLAVDLSGSMDHEDFTNSAGRKTNRLNAAKEVLGDFLQEREGDRVGIVVFGNAPYLQVPFTTDLQLCRRLLDETAVGMAGPRTALGDAIGLGIQLLENSEVPDKTMILLTDGNDTSSQVPPVEAARVARDRAITIHTVAMGDPTSVGEEKIDEEALKSVAASTEGGQFFVALNREELNGIYEKLDELETREIQTVSHRPRCDLYFWPLAAALIATLLASVFHVVRVSSKTPSTPVRTRLLVNARTFELETVDR